MTAEPPTPEPAMPIETTGARPDGPPRGLWRNSGFVRLWGVTTAANLADGITLAALPLAAAAITRDPLLISGVVVAQRLPWLLFSLPSGVLVDRGDRRLLLAAANALRAAGLAIFAGGLVAGVDHIALLYAAAFCLGTAETVADNASIAMLPAIVEREQLNRANGRIFAAMPIANELVGPPLGAWLLGMSAALAFGGSAAAFAAAAILALTISGAFRPHPTATAPKIGRELIEGMRWFARHGVIRAAALWAAGANLFGAATLGVLVLLAQQRLGLDGQLFGFLLAAGAVGGVAGGWAADRVVARVGPGPAVLAGNLVAAAGYAGLAWTRSAVVAGSMLALASLASMLGNVVAHTLRQTAVPDHLLGRVTSVYRVIGLGALPLGGLLGGWLASAFGIVAPYWAAAAGLTALGIVLARPLSTARIRAAAVPTGSGTAT